MKAAPRTCLRGAGVAGRLAGLARGGAATARTSTTTTRPLPPFAGLGVAALTGLPALASGLRRGDCSSVREGLRRPPTAAALSLPAVGAGPRGERAAEESARGEAGAELGAERGRASFCAAGRGRHIHGSECASTLPGAVRRGGHARGRTLSWLLMRLVTDFFLRRGRSSMALFCRSKPSWASDVGRGRDHRTWRRRQVMKGRTAGELGNKNILLCCARCKGVHLLMLEGSTALLCVLPSRSMQLHASQHPNIRVRLHS